MTTRKFTKLALATMLVACLAIAGAFVGCSSSSNTNANNNANTTTASLQGKTLNIYCGAGMTDPFTKIADEFKAQTGCEVAVTYANAAQIQTQIKTTESGDFFIAGSADELQPVESYVASKTDLVKHIPVLAVPNDSAITSFADLANCKTLLIGDPESTPIGKIAKKALTTAGIWEGLSASGAITTTTTAPQIAAALARGEGDAGIVWKENVKADGVKILDCAEMSAMIKTIPAAQLTCCADQDAAAEFVKFLGTDTAKNIWTSYGYELV